LNEKDNTMADQRDKFYALTTEEGKRIMKLVPETLEKLGNINYYAVEEFAEQLKRTAKHWSILQQDKQ
jgi:hypothetical protein